MGTRRSGLPAFVLAVLAGAVPGFGCDECTPGETRCDGDAVLVCVEDDSYEDDDTWEEGDGSCGLLCDILDILDEASDNYWDELEICDRPGQTCVERTDSSGAPYSACDYDPGCAWQG